MKIDLLESNNHREIDSSLKEDAFFVTLSQFILRATRLNTGFICTRLD